MRRVGTGVCTAGLAAVFAAATAFSAPSEGVQSLMRLSLEELSNITVTSVARTEQPLTKAAAAVHVLTQEDLRRSGATSIAEALRMVPGLSVARVDGSRWAISSRGNNFRFSNKLLVLIDGRSVYDPLFGGVFWDQQDTMLEDVDRIEVIRGPGAALWGVNAVEGVINILTKSASDTQGGLLVAGGGNEEKLFGRFRYGGKLDEDAAYRVWAKGLRRDDTALPTGADAHDAWSASRGGFRIDWDLGPDHVPGHRTPTETLTVQGELFDSAGEYRQAIASRRRPPSETLDEGLHAAGQYLRVHWRKVESPEADFSLRLYYDRVDRFEEFEFDEDFYDLDFQRRRKVGWQSELLWGVGARHISTRAHTRFFRGLRPEDAENDVFSAFIQDRFSWRQGRLELTLGSRFEHNDYTGSAAQPTARLRWSPDERRTWWTAVSRAVSTPVRNRLHLVADQAILPGAVPTLIAVFGNPDIGPERLLAYEAGYRHQFSSSLSIDLALFRNSLQDVIGSHREAPFTQGAFRVVPVVLDNASRQKAWGGELSATWKASDDWKLVGSYGKLQLDIDNPTAVSNQASPAHQASLRSYWDLSPKVQFDVLTYFAGDLDDIRIPSYVRADARLAWQARDDLELSVAGQNLIAARHAEFLDTRLGPPAREFERSVYAQARWSF